MYIPVYIYVCTDSFIYIYIYIHRSPLALHLAVLPGVYQACSEPCDRLSLLGKLTTWAQACLPVLGSLGLWTKRKIYMHTCRLYSHKIMYFIMKTTYSNRKLPYRALINTLLLILIPF